MRIAAKLLDEVVAHARREAPNECCGIIATRDGDAVSAHALVNTQASPFRFEIDGPTLMRLMDEIEDDGLTFGVVYHSHTRSAPYPSQTDINFAKGWPGVQWLIVGLAGDEPEVRNYLIDGGVVTEVPLRDDG